MNMGIKNIIKNNKSTLIIGVSTSLITTLLIIGVFFGLIASNTINISGVNSSKIEKSVKSGNAVENSKVMNAVAKAEPAVVSIIITKDVATVEQYYQQYNPFSNLFGNDDSNSSNNNTEQQEVGGGSGFFVSSDGYIVTNNHVVSDSSADYTVMTSDGTKYAAKILDTDPTMDVAIIKIEGKNFPYLKFADSSTLKLGQTAIAIGNALAEFQNSISMGIISGLSRSITASDNSGNSEQLDGVIQTDAAINSGNSGGPLLDIEGNVIGVNVAVENSANSIGFALPSNIVKSIAESVKDSGEIVKPYLGVRYTLVTDRIKKTNNLSVDYGALVIRGSSADELAVIPGSPANKAGIVENDIILEIDGVKINSDHSITSVIRQKSIGQTVTIKLQHGGKTKEVKVKLEKAPSNL